MTKKLTKAWLQFSTNYHLYLMIVVTIGYFDESGAENWCSPYHVSMSRGDGNRFQKSRVDVILKAVKKVYILRDHKAFIPNELYSFGYFRFDN